MRPPAIAIAAIASLVQSRTAIKLMIRACRRDRWALAPIVCYLREGLEGYAGCETLLTRRERAHLVAALTKAGPTIRSEQGEWIDTGGTQGPVDAMAPPRVGRGQYAMYGPLDDGSSSSSPPVPPSSSTPT